MQHYNKCGCTNGFPTYEICDDADKSLEAMESSTFTYNSLVPYEFCEKEYKTHTSARVCIDCRGKCVDGSEKPSTAAESRLVMKDGAWAIKDGKKSAVVAKVEGGEDQVAEKRPEISGESYDVVWILNYKIQARVYRRKSGTRKSISNSSSSSQVCSFAAWSELRSS